MAKRASANELTDDVVARIRADVQAMKDGTYVRYYGPPACVCGLNSRTEWVPEGLADYSGEIDRKCHRHEERS